MLPVVAIVGRPNVGKSTLYNALTRTRDAIVSDLPGVTRDRLYGVCRLGPRPFVVVDTGGVDRPQDLLAHEVARQAEAALAEAQLVLMVGDARVGLDPGDQRYVERLRRSGKPWLLVVNKIDGVETFGAGHEFSPLGVEPILVSAAHRQGLERLLSAIEARLPAPDSAAASAPDEAAQRPRIAIVGRPNVGKSTLVNRLVGEPRVLALDLPGTTRDAILVPWPGRPWVLVDTAGIRRRARVQEAVEKFSVIKALQAIESAEVVVVLLDARQGIAEQDAAILGHVLDAGRGLVIGLNKWDGLSRSARHACLRELDRRLDFAPWAKVIPISALHGSGLGELEQAIERSHQSASYEFSARALTESLQAIFAAHQPPLVRGHSAKFRYAHQGGKNPPRVVIHGSRLRFLPDSYQRYLENALRRRYKLVGTPIRLEFREGENPYAERRNELTERQRRKRRRLLRHVKG